MKQHKTSFLLIFLALLFTGAEFLVAQITVDVKTKWTEKKGLREVKCGVLSALEFSSEFRSVEFGEDYALWLRDLKRNRGNGDTVVLVLELELREPSLFQQGELIAARSVIMKYNQQTLDSIGNDLLVAEAAKNYQEQHQVFNEVLADAVVMLLPEAKMITGSLVSLLLKEFNEVPKVSEVYEGTLVGVSILAVLEEMLRT